MIVFKDKLKVQEIRHAISNGALMIVFISVLLNAILAAINAHVTYLNQGHVMISEFLILVMACGYIWLKIDRLSEHWRSVVFTYIIIIIFFWMIFFNTTPNIKFVRDMALIPIFLTLGTMAEEKGLVKMIRILTVVVVAFMLMEGWFTDVYVSIFKPASYYANTRGVQELSTDSSGLFRNSLGFSGRFSYGIFGTHRLSSVLLEQVSLANYSMVLGLFVVSFWDKLIKKDRIFFVFSIIFIILTNNTRTGSFVNLILIFGYFIFPILPKKAPVFYIPLLLLTSFAIFYDPSFHPGRVGDDLQGRVGTTIFKIATMNFQTLFTGDIGAAVAAQDNGYLYLIYSQTGLGFLVFWLYTSLIVPAVNTANKRFANGLGIFIAVNLLIGAGIFTIKVAAPLWFIAGYLMKNASKPQALETVEVNANAHAIRA